ncbi:MAG: hypothetical protein JO273_07705, partial [Methylobacteriaceae bacterium]|nr:hypothetical protein [Methylobacteriaceae bacterium]
MPASIPLSGESAASASRQADIAAADLAGALHDTARRMRDSLSASPPAPREGAEPVAVAVVIPCFNEAAAIGGVIGDFRAALP